MSEKQKTVVVESEAHGKLRFRATGWYQQDDFLKVHNGVDLVAQFRVWSHVYFEDAWASSLKAA